RSGDALDRRRTRGDGARRVHEPDGPLRDGRDDLDAEPDGLGRSLRALDRPRANPAAGNGARVGHRQQREPDLRHAGRHRIPHTTATSLAPATTRCSCSTRTATWSDARCGRGTCTVPTGGARCSIRWSRGYRGQALRRLLRGDAAFALPDVYEYLEAEGFRYAIRLPANQVLQNRIAHLLTRPVGRPPHYVRRFHASFRYQAQSWSRPRRVVAKVEWHPGELYPRVGFIVTNLHRPAKKVVAVYNGRGTAEQWIKEGKNAVKWTRLSCTTFRANAVRLQLHALAYNLANFLRTLALPGEVERWSLTTLREKVMKIGAKVVAHGRYLVFQMAE